MKSVQKIGHRGAKAYIAENTLESIQRALDLNVDAIEVDVHKCRTGELLVFHDFTLDRLTDGSGEIAKKSYAELKELFVSDSFKIPLLTEVLDLIERKCLINIELKGLNTAHAACQIIHEYIKDHQWSYSDIIVSSFQRDELEKVRKVDAQIQIGVLSKASVTEAIKFGEKLKAVAIHPSLGIITRDSVRRAHDSGFKVNVWTVNEPEDIERMKEFGVDGIISDYPDRL